MTQTRDTIRPTLTREDVVLIGDALIRYTDGLMSEAKKANDPGKALYAVQTLDKADSLHERLVSLFERPVPDEQPRIPVVPGQVAMSDVPGLMAD